MDITFLAIRADLNLWRKNIFYAINIIVFCYKIIFKIQIKYNESNIIICDNIIACFSTV